MKKNKQESVGDRKYQPEDYEGKDQVSKGLASSHEQVSDTLTEGTIDGSIDAVDENGQLISNKKGKPL
ncbi:YozQ family protein [Halobacillus sp. Marseille-Q1614]|uniref:YozQ family protein n=1 Tax=Halobacillus sp. Marseille-Q1614 TaxID=2709134 RepID=UPI0015708358|nr:YozQ family protein [Halobacillus sp. Marseille-Q1614]